MGGSRWAIVGLGGALALGSLTASAAPALADCDGAFATTLHAAPASDARAYWLNRQLLKWPGADAASGVFKLYFSATAQLRATAGARVAGADGAIALSRFDGALPADIAQRFKFVGNGAVLAVAAGDAARVPAALQQQALLVLEAEDGTVRDATALQLAGALDDIYASAAKADDLGVTVGLRDAGFKLWAPTAQNVALCTYDNGTGKANTITPMVRDEATGIWSARAGADGQYYQYLVDVVAPGAGLVRNLVTDPYSISLTTDSKRSYIADLGAAKLKPAGWDKTPSPNKVAAQTDMTVYELHVRDFSINDSTVSAPHRGKYAAFTETRSNGMKHLAALSKAGMTDIHLLPVYDIGSVPEQGCVAPKIPAAAPDSEAQQAVIEQIKFKDCYNWGYDPFHYSAPEGSYSTDPADGARRIVEFRQMVQALHKTGLRVGMDVVYNHTYIAGQSEKSVLDRVVPGYYHRLNAKGDIERSTCCDNTATENLMMGKLMVDSVALWAKQYKIDSFRFDLMGHQPRAAMEQIQARVGKQIHLIGEGWNFGEVADGARFVQASQLSLNGSGIGTFSDRGRDAVRGGGAGDSGGQLISQQGYINGLIYDANEQAGQRPLADLLHASDMVKVGLAGTIRSYPLTIADGRTVALQDIVYGGNQPAGYASEPGETVNYVENHDNQTLYDINAFKLPQATTARERAQVQMLGAAINAFSQGVAYFHAGFDILRSKSLDRNSFESGDWFNRLDWSYKDNYYGTGLPPAADNGKDYALIKPLLRNANIKPAAADIAYARDAFRDLLAIRSSSALFRLRTAEDIKQRLRFFNTGPSQVPTVIAAHIDGKGYQGARFKSITYLINVDKVAQRITVAEEKGRCYQLHPVHTSMTAADKRVASQAKYDKTTGTYVIPARSAVVFVEN
ncbi:alpha-1,6-glucosidases, pullulanase-type [Duganella sp. CF402]|uniref:alpha-1,6-glucosidase domain-containing protein n=1 Tax=unclassified Duganella TaxID=2636909 RepID=UPI0008CAB1FC|nr:MULTISPECIES: alpha-1,6-glucosidase domain-containing protein [unclassified Duganella]RZT08827.1 pullulanase-type alpha-1,6-glucosidase [Duganella sp. BK701]SEL80417.1 alpha-1,6-glucosidases, pullulanase-type [Duganella sp. CF402]